MAYYPLCKALAIERAHHKVNAGKKDNINRTMRYAANNGQEERMDARSLNIRQIYGKPSMSSRKESSHNERGTSASLGSISSYRSHTPILLCLTFLVSDGLNFPFFLDGGRL